MQVDLIAGTRPNFVKIAAIIHANKKLQTEIKFRLIHTGQHYDKNLSESFFFQLDLPEPDYNLKAGSGSQAEQTAAIMVGYEKILRESVPDICLVVGDVTSSMACAITAKKMQVKVAHVEAGIRSGDLSMPEEVNRIIIDSISNYFFTTTKVAANFLVKQGCDHNNVFFVGNTMIDTLLRLKSRFTKPTIWNQLQLSEKEYFIVTLHRPSNVSQTHWLKIVLQEILMNSEGLPVIFPAHPRTIIVLNELQIKAKNLHILDSLGYLEFNYLVEKAKAVITDSGGITEETTVMNVPCLTLRENTERPETIEVGTNELIGISPSSIAPAMKKVIKGKWKNGNIPELWDGETGLRIVQLLNDL